MLVVICCTAIITCTLLMTESVALSYRTCESPDGRVEDMFIPGCEGVDSCIMHRGHTRTIHIKFFPYRPVAEVTTVVHVRVGWFSFRVSLDEPDACLYNVPCPLASGNNYEYVFNISIANTSRTFSGTIRWELKDEDGQDLVCAEFAGGIA